MKKYLLLLSFGFTVLQAGAQLSIQPVLPLAGIIQKTNLWNIAVINTSASSYDCRIEMTLRNRASGLEVLTATTGQFLIAPGTKQLNASLLLPVHYNYVSATATARADELIPIGDYTACYRLILLGKNLITEECASFDVEPLSPPMLITPLDSAVCITAPTQFGWIPPAPMNLFSRLQYEVVITEILPGQKPEEAIQQNLPFYTEPNLQMNTLSYRGSASDFEKEKWYAWQVTARDDNSYAGKSEVWIFKIEDTKTIPDVVAGAPYVRMKMNAADMAIAPNGFLKLSYSNRYADSTMNVSITDMSESKGMPFSFTATIKPGENLIKYDLKKMRPKEETTYRAVFKNAAGEEWMLLFRVKNFKDRQ